MKKFLIASAIAASLATAAFAAPTQFMYSEADTSVLVPLAGSVTTTINVDAQQLFDASQLILIEYGASDAASNLRVKQLIAPQGINITLDSVSLATSSSNEAMFNSGAFDDRMISLEVTVSKDATISSAVPVQLVLENTATGQTYTVNVLVSTAF